MTYVVGKRGHSDETIVSVCDTEFYSARDGFSAFREIVAAAFMPWFMEHKSDQDFNARIVRLSGEFGSLSRTKMTPLLGMRNKSEISKSPEGSLYANYVISGRLVVTQNDVTVTAEKGDLVLYDSTLPVKHLKLGDASFEDLAFCIPKERIGRTDKTFDNLLVSKVDIIPPLASCFAFLSHNISSAQPEELAALGGACAALLPISGGRSHEFRPDGIAEDASNHYARELVRFIDARIADAELCPSMAADNLGISVRYVHKQFAMLGTTFSSYVTSRRLERISHDLISGVGANPPISVLAYRWGFRDLSTFIRCFKRKFGCSPREYRSKF